ncbi:MAG: TadE/TadG family type IV pilus assembly protein [Actinomycetota bacterium]
MSARTPHATFAGRRRGERLLSSERGASAVEFALLAPLLLMVVLGMFSGGLAYARKIALTDAAREGVRHAATLPTGSAGVPNSWFESVAQRAMASAAGDLAETWPGQYICVAYIGYGSPISSSTDQTRKREKSGAGAAVYTNGSTGTPATWCFDDGRGSDGNERRVQVVVRRNSQFDALLWSTDLTLTSEAVARYESVPPS